MAVMRVGQSITSAWPTGTQPGDVAFRVANMASAPTPSLLAGWTDIYSVEGLYGYARYSYKVLTAGDIAGSAFQTGSFVEVWAGVLPSGVTFSSGSFTASPVIPPAASGAAGSTPLWLMNSVRASGASSYVSSVTPSAGVMGSFSSSSRSGAFFGPPIAGTTAPLDAFVTAGAGTLRIGVTTVLLEPSAPPYNMFRIDASGETGLTPYLLGATAAADTEIRWTP